MQDCITVRNACQTYVRIGVLPLPMLRFLSIKRLAVIDAVEAEFGPGLNVLTGETGAGKSILVEAVGLTFTVTVELAELPRNQPATE